MPKNPVHFAGYFASPLRYPGGKGRLGPWLARVVESNKLSGGWYVEPFAGGAGAALYLLMESHVDHIVINDDDPLIYSFWQAAVHHTEELIEHVRSTPVDMCQRERLADIARDHSSHSVVEVGFATFFLNRTSRSGILTGGVIGGRGQNGTYKLNARYNADTLIERIQRIGQRREQISVVGIDALSLLGDCADGFAKKTLIYLDPPYFEKGSQLYRNHYKPSDHSAIASCASRLSLPLLITYDDHPEIRELYRGMSSLKFSLTYSSHVARPTAQELLIYSNLRLPSPPQLTRGSSL